MVEGTDASRMSWYFHPDENVDLAATILSFDPHARGLDYLYLPTEMMLSASMLDRTVIGIGDFAYTVGLFRLMAGRKRNLPIVHTGSIAMLPSDERVPVEDWE